MRDMKEELLVEEILEELYKEVAFFENRIIRLREGEIPTTAKKYPCGWDLFYHCPKCGKEAGVLDENLEYQEQKIPLKKDALCSECK